MTGTSNNTGRRRGARQGGFSIVTALFVLVVLALVGAYMVTLSGTQQATTTFALQGVRGYYAARAGIEWGTRQAFHNTPATCSAAPGSTTTTVALSGNGLNGFNVDVACSYTQHRESGQDFCVFDLQAVARFGSLAAPADYVQRQVQATVANQGVAGSTCP